MGEKDAEPLVERQSVSELSTDKQRLQGENEKLRGEKERLEAEKAVKKKLVADLSSQK